MSIFPLPQFEKDLEEDRKAYENLKAPTSMVVRFGVMRNIGEYPYHGSAKPGCGTKLVASTHRGTELCEMLTSTCPNAGCGKSITRKEMLEYIDKSGGDKYPFFAKGKIYRVASAEDLAKQAAIDQRKPQLVRSSQAIASSMRLEMKIVEAEPILGAERLSFYYTAEERVDFRELVSVLAREHGTRIEMVHIGARDEARLTADYERCGQHCCCRQFLKVLKPVSMRSAKVQKATLDPLKISGRCGRLMCCLRYEDKTYDDLKKRLPRRKTRVMTPEGIGLVLDTQILTQLVLVRLEDTDKQTAFPVEDISTDLTVAPAKPKPRTPRDDRDFDRPKKKKRRKEQQDLGPTDSPPASPADDRPADPDAAPKKKKRRRKRKKRPEGEPQTGDTDPRDDTGRDAEPDTGPRTPGTPERRADADEGDGTGDAADRPKKKRRRRRRRKPSSGDDGSTPPQSPPNPPEPDE